MKGEESSEKSRVVVRVGDVQIEVEGTLSTVNSLMGNKQNVFEVVRELLKITSETPLAETVSTVETEAEELPPQLGKPATCTEALSTLFKTEWGKHPRTLSEIMEVLELNGLYYRKSAVAKILTDLMKRKEIRRLGTRGNFKYVSSHP